MSDLKFPATVQVKRTIERLRTTTDSLVQISKATGFSTRWLNAMRAGAIPNPGVMSIHALAVYFARRPVRQRAPERESA